MASLSPPQVVQTISNSQPKCGLSNRFPDVCCTNEKYLSGFHQRGIEYPCFLQFYMWLCIILVWKSENQQNLLLYDLRISLRKYLFCTVIAVIYCTNYVLRESVSEGCFYPWVFCVVNCVIYSQKTTLMNKRANFVSIWWQTLTKNSHAICPNREAWSGHDLEKTSAIIIPISTPDRKREIQNGIRITYQAH